MPTPTNYTYSLASGFPDGAINSTKLASEIGVSSIITALDRIDVSGDVVDVWFKDVLSSGDKTTLDGNASSPAGGLIAAHDATPTATATFPVEIAGVATGVTGVLHTVTRPASVSYEMCDRDILIKTSVYDARALAVLAGVDANGHIAYAASTPGAYSNYMSVEHKTGSTGAGHESRALDAAFTTATYDLVVTFGTDGSGASVVPTAAQVVSMLAAKVTAAGLPMVLPFIFPALVGDGSTAVQVVAKTNLAGGASPSAEDTKINPTTFARSEWNELQQFGVYKKVGDDYVACSDQTDAATNACLSVWRYIAHNQTTSMPTTVELRDGLLFVDATTSDSLEHQAFAIGAPQIPVALGGGIVQFDAYLKFYKGQVLGATSPQAKALLVDGPAGVLGAELRVYVYYPAGAQNTHVLRLVTYRLPGTF